LRQHRSDEEDEMALEPSEEQLWAVLAAAWPAAREGGDESISMATLRAAFPVIRDIVLEEAAKACEAVECEWLSGQSAQDKIEAAIRAMKGAP